MKIAVGTAVGQGPTPLAAYDYALQKLGAHDMNLVVLSSVIPQGWIVERLHPSRLPQLAHTKKGDRLYVVQAFHSTSEPGQLVSAGLGWARTAGEDGFGLFYEEHGAEDADAVKVRIHAALDDMIARRPDFVHTTHTIRDVVVASVRCTTQSVCALALAVYKSEPW